MNSTLNFRKGDVFAGLRPEEDRYFSLDGKWFFTTREGVTMGPFDSRAQAVSETSTYISFINSAKSPVLKIMKREKFTIPQE